MNATHRKIQHLNSSRRLFIQLAIACLLSMGQELSKIKLETPCKRNTQIVQIITMPHPSSSSASWPLVAFLRAPSSRLWNIDKK